MTGKYVRACFVFLIVASFIATFILQLTSPHGSWALALLGMGPVTLLGIIFGVCEVRAAFSDRTTVSAVVFYPFMFVFMALGSVFFVSSWRSIQHAEEAAQFMQEAERHKQQAERAREKRATLESRRQRNMNDDTAPDVNELPSSSRRPDAPADVDGAALEETPAPSNAADLEKEMGRPFTAEEWTYAQ